jgi:aminoglycoside 3-N-acetyltransferase
MYRKQDLLDHLKDLEIDGNGTLLVHSSMKSIGHVEVGRKLSLIRCPNI